MRSRWAAWGSLIHRLIAHLAAIASLAGLLIPYLPPLSQLPWWAIALLLIAVVAFFGTVVLEWQSSRSRRVYYASDRNKIRAYMHDLIGHGGRVAVWSRDLSWAENADTRNLLIRKAQEQELILCLPNETPLSAQLAAAGAEVCVYGNDRFDTPASRFTIAFYGRAGSRVAVGHVNGDVHIIDEFRSSDHPAFFLAEDLVSLARARRSG